MLKKLSEAHYAARPPIACGSRSISRICQTAVPVHLLRDGGQQNQPEYRSKESVAGHGADAGGRRWPGYSRWRSSSISTETHPLPRLLPASAEGRACVPRHRPDHRLRHPSENNLRILQYLSRESARRRKQKDAWYRHWVNDAGLAVENPRRPSRYRHLLPRRNIPWPTAAWCRRSSTPAASTARSTTCRPSGASSTPANNCLLSERRHRRQQPDAE